jgi:CRP/FNR family transcriptional regulator, cyclic AMP receptor protein
MNSPFPQASKPSLKGLVEAVINNQAEDSLSKQMPPEHWEVLEPYMQSFTLARTQVLLGEGETDRTVFFLESGSLSVHYEDASGRVHLAIVNAGSAVGEGAFFSQMPRSATVQAAGECKVWNLTYIRFLELSQKQPKVALALAMGLGSIVSKRLTNRRKRVSVT